jgi:site-specific recombinase XerD
MQQFPSRVPDLQGRSSSQTTDTVSRVKFGLGKKLANDGHDTRAIHAYLGHRNIQNTMRYTALAPHRFKEFFRD